MRKHTRKIAVLLLIVMAVVALSGCSTTTQTRQIDPANSFWDRYFVYPLSFLLDYFNDIFGTYGLSILVVTFLVRLVIFPLSWKQQKSMQEMQVIQPQMQKLRQKYKKNPEKMQQEMMKLYKEHNVNPMAGCLPMLIQFPIFIAFYQAIQFDPQISKSSFLYLHLGSPDPYLILPIIAALTTYIQMIVQGNADNPQTRIMVWIFPIMIFVIGYSFPSALALYWVYSNLFTIIQYVALNPKKFRKGKVSERASR